MQSPEVTLELRVFAVEEKGLFGQDLSEITIIHRGTRFTRFCDRDALPQAIAELVSFIGIGRSTAIEQSPA